MIVFTDPDFSGEKIRKTISAAVPDVKHAFLARRDAVPSKKGSLGVEHATPQAIRDALDKVYTEVSDAPQTITRADLLDADLIAGQDAKQRRMELCEILNIGYVNGKQLLKRLQLFQISDEDFQDAVSKLGQE